MKKDRCIYYVQAVLKSAIKYSANANTFRPTWNYHFHSVQ